MRKLLYFIPFALLISCGDPIPEDSPEDKALQDEQDMEFTERMKREVEASLEIPVTEKYTFKIYKEFINSDTIEDAIITVNRFEFAKNEAIRMKKQAKMAEIGYMGKYNFFFYYDGKLDQISVPLPAPSSPGRELDVQFASICSPTRKDVILGHRIMNSGYKTYFTVLNDHDLSMVFQWKEFDQLGEAKPEAILHKLVPSKTGIGMDIQLYESEIDNYNPTIADIYKYVPSITKPKKLLYNFFYVEQAGKFAIQKPK
jgi:hypothetical protein